jgi:hypothetical protein
MNRTWLTPSAPLILLALVVTLVGVQLAVPHASAPLRLETAAQETSSPAQPEATPRVMVNGQEIDLGAGGSATVNLPSGHAQVQSGGGTTTITATGGSSTSVVSSDGDLNVNVQSDANGSTSVSSAQVQSSSSGSSWSSSFSSSSQTVFGTGQGSIRIDQP